MATANLLVKIYGYSDVGSTYDPQLICPDWSREINGITTGEISCFNKSCPAGNTTITLSAATINFLYIEVDRNVYIRLNGDTGTTVLVSPSAAGVKDGVYLKRGAVTGLVINNPGATAVNAKIFMGE